MSFKTLYIILLIFSTGIAAEAQQENRFIRKGNKHYDKGEFNKAEIDYIKSTQSGKASHKGVFNLGNSWYMQKDYMQASAAFDTLRTFSMDDQTRAKSYYNLGNSMLKLALDSAQLAPQLLPSTVEAYKQSLRLNPDDIDAKYNLAYAQRLMEKSQQQQQDQQKDQQQDQQKDQQQEQQQDQQKQQEQQQQNEQEQEQEQDKEQQQQEQQRNQPQEISKEDAERILEALKNDEKQTLEKLRQAQIKQMRVVKTEKDW